MVNKKYFETYIIEALQKNRQVFHHILADIDQQIIYWRPSPEKWCLLEIVCHLYDEECEDFGARVKHVLETPEKALRPINPEAWVTKRRYLEQDYEEMLSKFLEARKSSVLWLKSLEAPKWTNTLQHPERGDMSAGKFLVNWLAHDYLHIRQINRVQYLYLKSNSSEDLEYAGKW
jgi:hypothetical protein